MEWLVYTERFLQFPVHNKCCIGFAISISLSLLTETMILRRFYTNSGKKWIKRMQANKLPIVSHILK